MINYRNGINAQYAFLLGNVEGSDVVSRPARERLTELERLWAALRGQVDGVLREDVPAFNKLLLDAGAAGVIVSGKKPALIL